jgi:hypothetical protein
MFPVVPGVPGQNARVEVMGLFEQLIYTAPAEAEHAGQALEGPDSGVDPRRGRLEVQGMATAAPGRPQDVMKPRQARQGPCAKQRGSGEAVEPPADLLPRCYPVDWQEEYRLERNLLLARAACCQDAGVRPQLQGLADTAPHSEREHLEWGERLKVLEHELRGQGRLPAYPWPPAPAEGAK